ncbi:patatin-like phospholipase family protein [Pontibacter russatus]|uniref:patatin-like phospholipase family protein n=1 Tax=Pontibacter russatus TaxID=2694929 RepID=UPI00137ACCAF|nr:patatin-like phospholipase family protein [Pontibacter russatus]
MKKLVLVIICILCLSAASAQEAQIRNLVFEGAGIRGLAYAGVIAELERQRLLQDVEKVGGTSAGAITALMVSLGYSAGEMEDIISDTKFQKFNDGRFIFVGGLLRMRQKYGWYRSKKFAGWLEDIIRHKTGNADITFRELHDSGHRDLYITATCLNRQKLLVFSYETYPDMKVKDAVRASMSVPLYFEAVFIDSTGNVHQKHKRQDNLDIMVDGGILGNFPITLFDSVATDSLQQPRRIANRQTLGARIDSDEQIKNDALSKELVPLEIRNLQDYVSAFYILALENLNRSQLEPADWERTISVSSVGIAPRVKRLTKAQKALLVNSGREHTAAYLNAKSAE